MSVLEGGFRDVAGVAFVGDDVEQVGDVEGHVAVDEDGGAQPAVVQAGGEEVGVGDQFAADLFGVGERDDRLGAASGFGVGGEQQIVEGATALLDAVGVDGFSMRRLAARLEVAPMSIYEHVAGKEDILDLALDAAFAEIDPEPPASPARRSGPPSTRSSGSCAASSPAS